MLILAASLAIFIYGMTAATLGTILPDLSTRFHLTPKQDGNIAFCQALGLVLASIGVGLLIDYEGKKVGIGPGPFSERAGCRSAASSQRLARHCVRSVFARSRRRHHCDGGQRSRQRRDSGPSRYDTEFPEYLLRGRRFCHAVRLRQPARQKLHAPLSPDCGARSGGRAVSFFAPIPPPTAGQSFVFSDIGSVLGRPVLWLCALLLFLYVACEVGVWNWLVQHLIAQGVPQGRALNVLSFGFALGMLFGRLGASEVLISVRGLNVTLAASILMAILTFLMLQTRNPSVAWVLTFLAGMAMGPGVSHHGRAGGRCVSSHDRDRDRHRDYVRMDRPGGQLAGDRLHRRGRPYAPEESFAGFARDVVGDGRGESGAALSIIKTQRIVALLDHPIALEAPVGVWEVFAR